MKVMLIYAHPKKESFYQAILEETLALVHNKGHKTIVRDLYYESFNPTLTLEDFQSLRSGEIPEDIATEQEHIKWSDRIILIHPIWWGGMPAILKGYIDRVFSYGFAFEYKNKVPTGLLKDKDVLIINTTGTAYEHYERNGGHDSIKFITDQAIFGLCGIKTIDHIFYGSIPFVDRNTKLSYLEDLYSKLDRIF